MLLAGCNKNEEVENNNSLQGVENQQQEEIVYDPTWLGGAKALIDYDVITKNVDNEIVKNIEYVGISDYWLQILEYIRKK